MRIGIDGRNLTQTRTGIGRYVEEMCLALLRIGHDLRVYAPAPLNESVAEQVKAVTKASSAHSISARMAWGQIMLPDIAKRDRLDVFWGPSHRLPAYLPGDLASALTIHDLVWKLHPETMRLRTFLGERVLMPLSLRRADGIIAVTEATAASIRSHFPHLSAPMTVIHPGAPTDRHLSVGPTMNVRTALPTNYILFVGTLEPRKNLNRLLRAYGSLPSALTAQVPLVLAGGKGWHLKNLQQTAQLLGIIDRTHFLGYVDETELRALYEGCLFLALPSIFEGFGLPIVEANRRGRPALIASSSSMPEVGGEAAHLVDPFDVGSIASGLRTMIEDTVYREALAANARANANRFDWDKSALTLTTFLQNLVDKRRIDVGNR